MGLYASNGTAFASAPEIRVSPIPPAEANNITLSPGRVTWLDDSARTGAVRTRTVSGDATLTVGATTVLPTGSGSDYMLAASGTRTVYGGRYGGEVHVHRAGDAGFTVLPGQSAAISGTRVVHGAQVRDLVTGSDVALPANADRVTVWGHRVAYEVGGAVHVLDLTTGTETVVLGASGAFALWGDRLAWFDFGSKHVKVTDLVSGATRILPVVQNDWALSVALSGSYVAILSGAAPARFDTVTVFSLAADDSAPAVTTISGARHAAGGLSLDGSRLAWIDGPTGLPKVAPLPHVVEAPRYLGNPFAPAGFVPGAGPWRGEWVFTKPLPTCAVTIRSGATVVRTLGCATANGSALASWDGTDSRGRTVAVGSYTWTVTAADADGAALAEDGTASPISGAVEVRSAVGFDADGRADLVGRKPTGELYLYRGNGTGGFTGPATRIGTGWHIFNTLLSPGDFTGDGHPDLIARKTTGELYLYRGNGTGSFTGPATRIGTGWQILNAVVGVA